MHNAPKAALTDVAYHLPAKTLTNEDITRQHPDWSVQKIAEKTGIDCRHIAEPDETAADLAYHAARKLLESGACSPDQVDLLVFCSQSPDYALPTTACVLQDRLGLPTTCLAFDYNLGCSGFVYGLAIVKGLLESGQATRALLLTADTYSKWIDPADKSVKTIFGDGAAASLVELVDVPDGQTPLGPFVYGTDGSGFNRLIVPGSGCRPIREQDLEKLPEGHARDKLFMDGPEIFTFTIRTVPRTVTALLEKASATIDDVDLFVFHQANAYMLDHLRKRSKIPEDKFPIMLQETGNTVSASIPIVLKKCQESGKLADGMTVALVGFGVGYSWAAGVIQWRYNK